MGHGVSDGRLASGEFDDDTVQVWLVQGGVDERGHVVAGHAAVFDGEAGGDAAGAGLVEKAAWADDEPVEAGAGEVDVGGLLDSHVVLIGLSGTGAPPGLRERRHEHES
jgi:hypothetical protein